MVGRIIFCVEKVDARPKAPNGDFNPTISVA
jgi:hypothetical protein